MNCRLPWSIPLRSNRPPLAAGLAAPGEAVVSNVVRELAAGKGFGFELKETDAPGEDDERMRLFSLR